MNARTRTYIDADDAPAERIRRGRRLRGYGPALAPLPRRWWTRGMPGHQRLKAKRWFGLPAYGNKDYYTEGF